MKNDALRFLCSALLLAACGGELPTEDDGTGDRAAETTPGPGGVLLDGHGGIHAFGGATVNKTGAPSWTSDVARAIAVLPDGSGGWTLDDKGGIHHWGAAPAISGAPTFSTDIARALVVLADKRSGYVLDGHGVIHRFGAAPALPAGPTWPTHDIARGLDVHYDATGKVDGAWMLDEFGTIHLLGAAPSLGAGHHSAGVGLFRKLHHVGDGALLLARWGIVEKVGSPTGISFANMPQWGSWDIVRDVVPLHAAGGWQHPPVHAGAASALMDTLMNHDRATKGIKAMAESAILDRIAGGAISYNLAHCGGPNVTIGDRSADMYHRDYFNHPIQGCAGTKYAWDTYYKAAGYTSWTTAGENVAWNASYESLVDDAVAINEAWLQSPEHYANIMDHSFTKVGCGASFHYGGTYQGWTGPLAIWTCDFGN